MNIFLRRYVFMVGEALLNRQKCILRGEVIAALRQFPKACLHDQRVPLRLNHRLP